MAVTTLTTRSVGVIVSAALAAGWIGATLTRDAAPAQSTRSSITARSTAAAPVPHAEKLRERMAEPPLPSRGRNPFVYAARTATIRDHQLHGNESPAAIAPPAMPPAPPAPIFRLSGIASNTENGFAVLTAIVIDNGTMVFAKAGDKLSNGHSVVRIDEQSITLVDASGVTQTLRLP
jgi:hypothetical protein